jgi:electron transfer flavoprotein beta subunit
MNIVVCVKYVPDATAERTFNDSDNTVDRVGVDGLLSELDEYAVEQALQAVEKTGDGEITVLTVGPEAAVDAVRKGLQMGAHKGVHVVDEAIHGSDAVATSLVLAKAIEKVGADSSWDMVVCGMASTDGSMSVVPAMLAERLDAPQVTMGSEITVDGNKVTIRRDGDAATEVVEGETPLVLSVTD